jgi:hypothetical protein
MNSRNTCVGLAIFLIACSPAVGAANEAEKPRVLYLGDSMSIGTFGQTLDTFLRSSGFDVYTVVAGGATPYYWLKNYQALPCTIGFWEKSSTTERRVGYVRSVPKLEDLLIASKPHVVVVQTGINLYATLRSKRRSKEENVGEVRSLIEQMCDSIARGGAVSYWVLPPHSHEERYSLELQEELADLMRGAVKKYEGAVFESQKVTHFVDPYPATDGIHYGPEEARGWAAKVSEDFNKFMEVAPKEAPALIVKAIPLQSSAPQKAINPLEVATGEPSATLPDEVELKIRLLKKSGIANLAELEYANALGVYEYQVVSDTRGNYPYDRIRIAQGIVFGRKLTGAAKAEIGSERDLVLVPLSTYSSLSTWQVIDELRPNFEMPLYTPKLD